MKLKLTQVNNELKTHLNNMKNSHNPSIKAQHKAKAANALKKRKMYEGQLQNLESSQFTLDSMKIQSEMMKDQMSVVRTMQEANNAQKSMMKEMNADDMFDIAMDMRDMKDEMDEMNEVFQETYRVDVEDDELDAELDELQFNDKDNNFDVDVLTAPNKKILSKKEADEKKLEEDLL